MPLNINTEHETKVTGLSLAHS